MTHKEPLMEAGRDSLPGSGGDRLVRALSPSCGLRLAFTDVTGAAQEIERRHLSGAAASTVLGQALVAVSLLTVHLKSEDEAISLRLTCNGPLGGVLVEAWGGGALRGYTHRKLLPEHDRPGSADSGGVLGDSGLLTVIHSAPGTVIYSGTVGATPPDVRTATARWFNESQQTKAAVDLLATTGADGWLNRAVGVVAEKLPGGDTARFVAVLERFQDATVRGALLDGAGLEELGARLGLADLETFESRPLRFGCRCSREKVETTLLTLPREDLVEMIAEDHEHDVTCHFCAERYAVTPAEIETLLRQRDSWQ